MFHFRINKCEIGQLKQWYEILPELNPTVFYYFGQQNNFIGYLQVESLTGIMHLIQ